MRNNHAQSDVGAEGFGAGEALPKNAPAKERMAHRLATKTGRALYRLRKQAVEPVLAIIKKVMSFGRFRLRGRAKVSLQWMLVA